MMFCDVVGFTTFCENRAVEEVVSQMNEYLEAMTDVVYRWKGTVIDFIGDEVYALWGAPLDQPDHVELAVKCALHMRGRLADLNKKWEAEGRPPLDHGIGLNTGTVLVANMGAAGRRMKYTTIGDPVNLASRVEGLTRKFSTSIMVTEYTAARMKELVNGKSTTGRQGRLGHVALRMVASVKVKGKDKPVTVYDVKALQHDEPSRVEEFATLETVTMVEK